MVSRPKPRGSLILKIIIVFLLGILIYTIWEPFETIRVHEQNKAESRLRMSNLRSAQMFYYSTYYTFQRELDSLITWVATDSVVITKQDSLFKPLAGGVFVAESLKYSPLSHTEYIMMVDDTSRTLNYMIECPDGFGSIGDITDPSQLHRGSWE